MKLFKALAMAEEMNCKIIHRITGLHISPQNVDAVSLLPAEGWELDETPGPFSFSATFMACDSISVPGGREGAVYSFATKPGESILTLMAPETKVKVLITPE